jgi:hypothetical protein
MKGSGVRVPASALKPPATGGFCFDLKSVGDGSLRDQTLGNITTLIARRQNVPESADLIAAIAGTRPAWVTTQQTDAALLGTGPADAAHAAAATNTRSTRTA